MNCKWTDPPVGTAGQSGCSSGFPRRPKPHSPRYPQGLWTSQLFTGGTADDPGLMVPADHVPSMLVFCLCLVFGWADSVVDLRQDRVDPGGVHVTVA